MPALQNATNQNAFSTHPAGKRSAHGTSSKETRSSHRAHSKKTRQYAKENAAPTGDGSRKKRKRRRRRSQSPDPAVIQALEKERMTREACRGIGRMTVRFVNAFDDLKLAFHWGRELEAGTTGLDENQRRSAALYMRLVSVYPELRSHMDALGPAVVANEVASGQGQARGDDTFVVRSLAMHVDKWDIPITDLDDKSRRGMRCEGMAVLLVPSDIHIEDNPAAVLEFQQGDRPLEPHTLPHLCFDDGLTDSGARMFLNIMPMKCARGVLHGAQSALRSVRRPGNTTARKYGIFTVTDEFVAYIHCLVCPTALSSRFQVTISNQFRYAISSEPTFTFDGSNGFDYRIFYKTILDTISDVRRSGPAGKEAMAQVIKEWNEYIFGPGATAAASVPEEERLQRAAAYKAELIARFTCIDDDMRLSPDPEPAPSQPLDDEQSRDGDAPRGDESESSPSESEGSESSESSDESDDSSCSGSGEGDE